MRFVIELCEQQITGISLTLRSEDPSPMTDQNAGG